MELKSLVKRHIKTMYRCEKLPISKVKFSKMCIENNGELFIYFEVWHHNTIDTSDSELITTFGFSLFREKIFKLF